MQPTIRIGTRESELAVWQATMVKNGLAAFGYDAVLIPIKSEGDIDLKTPLYEMGVQGIFTRSLDTALLNEKIDIAVHSMKDVPIQLPVGIVKGAVLERGNYKDLFVMNKSMGPLVNGENSIESKDSEIFINSLKSDQNSPLPSFPHLPFILATSSIRRKAQWLNRYPGHQVENLRGNVNTRLKKLEESKWHGAIFAAAGLERIGLRPRHSVELDWMLPAPAQGAIMVVCRQADELSLKAVSNLNHEETDICTKIEKDFLKELLGGCSTPIGALAIPDKHDIYFRGNILSTEGKAKAEVKGVAKKEKLDGFGKMMAEELFKNGGKEIADGFRNGK